MIAGPFAEDLLLGNTPLSDPTSRTPFPPPASSVHAQRRDPGAPRREASDRVVLRRADVVEVIGWTLNVSRGGARLVVEDNLVAGQHWDLWVNDAVAARPVRVVWVRNEAGGQIVGIQFMDCEGTLPPFEDLEDGQ